jgi:large subunit ribosomal protein L15
LNRFEPNANLDIEALKKAGLVKNTRGDIKLLGEGDISHPVVIEVDRVSKAARTKIEAAGGEVKMIGNKMSLRSV